MDRSETRATLDIIGGYKSIFLYKYLFAWLFEDIVKPSEFPAQSMGFTGCLDMGLLKNPQDGTYFFYVKLLYKAVRE